MNSIDNATIIFRKKVFIGIKIVAISFGVLGNLRKNDELPPLPDGGRPLRSLLDPSLVLHLFASSAYQYIWTDAIF